MDQTTDADADVIEIEPNDDSRPDLTVRRPLPWPVALAVALMVSCVVSVTATKAFAQASRPTPKTTPAVRVHLVVVTTGSARSTYKMPSGSQVLTQSPTGDCSITIDNKLFISISGASGMQSCEATVP